MIRFRTGHQSRRERLDDPPVGEELLEVAAHRPIVGRLRRAEIRAGARRRDPISRPDGRPGARWPALRARTVRRDGPLATRALSLGARRRARAVLMSRRLPLQTARLRHVRRGRPRCGALACAGFAALYLARQESAPCRTCLDARRSASDSGPACRSPCSARPEEAAAAPAAPTFTLLLVNDIYRMGDDKGRGGFAKLAAVVKEERARGVPMLFCHAGRHASRPR